MNFIDNKTNKINVAIRVRDVVYLSDIKLEIRRITNIIKNTIAKLKGITFVFLDNLLRDFSLII